GGRWPAPRHQPEPSGAHALHELAAAPMVHRRLPTVLPAAWHGGGPAARGGPPPKRRVTRHGRGLPHPGTTKPGRDPGTGRTVVEYVAAQRERYAPASRPEKGRLLVEMVAVTGYHRKAVLRLLGGRRRAPPSGRRPGHPRVYGPEVAAAAQLVWAAGQIG